MDLFLDYTDKQIVTSDIKISGSKSESNRLLILQQFYPNLKLKNVSDSDDSVHLTHALESTKELIDIGHAGTAMRFLTAYFAVKESREVILTGSERMQNRPIKILVDALRMLGADIEYVEKEGYPPLRIKGKKITKQKVSINGNVSSQYISALVLIATSLEKGLEIELLEEITSRPYLEMTLNLLNQLGISTSWEENIIKIQPQKSIKDKTITVESDWSSASYFYSLVALSKVGKSITLSSYYKESLQGDSCLVSIYENFGVITEFNNNSITITKAKTHNSKLLPVRNQRQLVEAGITLNLKSAPDIAQTIVVTCFGLGIGCDLTGLHTLKIKETDRLVALQNELQKFGANIEITDKSLHLKTSNTTFAKNVTVKTYNDHRMAMAFAPLALKVPFTVQDADVVTKSYISFWEDLDSCLKG
ncbi:3-phosphoshikimate 1-carboxyvinyltransferase [Aureibaculum sp. 2210JD6-5]|uniref:3-phosphoshikimate 1-carboxyvinyltransferase n=1 Tax=Aureibaculum sp. 2210JD6-5 TaxID=3103957 RepID=UPI002AADDCA4|nr:3-phosphoshikimate 1-carboxyvinyltransferase [Aureibaculum sp. 2210JD6-5]MDY7396389.1 3-phosphoshikimate 1-carboxyvinyltransferase [Aureibaculum sp. 2210JD6-5]